MSCLVPTVSQRHKLISFYVWVCTNGVHRLHKYKNVVSGFSGVHRIHLVVYFDVFVTCSKVSRVWFLSSIVSGSYGVPAT